MANRLEGKVAVITGGASGIGESAARLFVRLGAKVIIADVQDDIGEAACRSIGTPDTVSYVHCDVTSETDVANAVNTAVTKHGKLDVMFSNAGTAGNNNPSIMATNNHDLERVFGVNLFGAFLCAKHAARVMVPAKRGGSIIFTSSVASVTSGGTSHAYAASKRALVGLAENLCVELRQYGIRVNCVSPFVVATPMALEGIGLGKEEAEEFVSEIGNLKGETLEARDVAEAAVFLASDESKYVYGQNLVIDGGYSATNVALREGIKKLTSS